LSGGAFANTIISLTPNDGSGDNFGFLQRGGGVVIGIGGGTPVDFFNFEGYAPGSTLGGETAVFFSGGFAQFGGKSYDLDFSGPGTLFLLASIWCRDQMWCGLGTALRSDGLGKAEFGGKQLGQPLLAARTTERNRFWNGQPVAR